MEQLVFRATVEALIKHAVRDKASPEYKTNLRAIGLDLDRPLPISIPREMFVKAVDVSAKTVFPGVEQTRAFYLLGERFMEGFFSTVVGRGMALLAKALGPRRMLERMDSNLRAGNNFMQSTVTEVRGTKFKLWLNEVNRHPHFIQGFLEHGLKYAGARDLLIEQSRYDGTSCTYLISWDES